VGSIDDMRLFARLVELRSFTAVAHAMQMARSLVSKRVSRLEDQLGVQLINRTTRRLELTEAGRTFYQYCQQMDVLRQEAEAAVGEIRQRPMGVLRLNAPVMFGQIVLPRIITGFLTQFPDVHVVLSLNDQYVDVIEGGYDLVIRIGNLKSSTMRARKVGSTRLRVYAHERYLAAHGTPRTPQDLKDHNCLLYQHQISGPNDWEFSGPAGKETVEVSGNFSAENSVPLYQAARDGLGITRMPNFIEEAFGRNGMVYLLEDYEPVVEIHAVYATTRKPPLNTRVFIDYLAERLSVRDLTNDSD
jgi:DNA-binding transcriptional LysR family regulator